MILQDLITLWACSRVTKNVDGEPQKTYRDLRSFYANVQTDYTEIDVAEFGEAINEVIKIRTDTPPPVSKNDTLYFLKPSVVGAVPSAGENKPAYPQGEYTVLSVKSAYIGGNHIKNPTLITARVVTK